MGLYMKGKKYSVGALYKLTFFDHCIGRYDKMLCEVVGWCLQDSDDHIVLTPWITVTDDEQIKKDNVEPYSIIKSTIKRSRKLL